MKSEVAVVYIYMTAVCEVYIYYILYTIYYIYIYNYTILSVCEDFKIWDNERNSARPF